MSTTLRYSTNNLISSESATNQQIQKTGPILKVLSGALTPKERLRLLGQTPFSKAADVVAGGVFFAEDEQGKLWASSGFIPCELCRCCQSGLPLACQDPWHLGINTDGGAAAQYQPLRGLVPLAELALPHKILPTLAAYISAAGATYQATATIGLTPGETVLLFHAPLDCAPFILHLLLATGLKPVWFEERAILLPPEAVTKLDPKHFTLDEIPPTRLHILDFQADADFLNNQTILELLPFCASYTFLSPFSTSPPNEGTFRMPSGLMSQMAIRQITDLHPHLLLDLAALFLHHQPAFAASVSAAPLEQIPSRMKDWVAQTGTNYPVWQM